MPAEGRNETIMGEERENRKRSRRQRKNKNRRMTLRQKTLALLTLDTILLIAVLITGGMLMARWYREKNRPPVRVDCTGVVYPGLSPNQSLFQTGNQAQGDQSHCGSLRCQSGNYGGAEPFLFQQSGQSDRRKGNLSQQPLYYRN